jgi:hypothetical protein
MLAVSVLVSTQAGRKRVRDDEEDDDDGDEDDARFSPSWDHLLGNIRSLKNIGGPSVV